jgi:hypothetical protein
LNPAAFGGPFIRPSWLAVVSGVWDPAVPVVSALPNPAALGDPCIRGVVPDPPGAPGAPGAPAPSAAQLVVAIDSKLTAAIKAVFRMTGSLSVLRSLLESDLRINSAH